MTFESDLATAEAMLRRRERVSLRAIAAELGIDTARAALIRDELVDVLGVADEYDGVLTTRDASRSGNAERRQMTFLFGDVVGSTPLSTGVDPEELRDVMIAYQRATTEAIARHDGHISQWIGDGVVVYFGYPNAHDDDAVRAVRAGLDIIAAVRDLDVTAGGKHISVRVGVHTGPAVVGDMGQTQRMETMAFGETPNLCARIESAADPNSVFISERTRRLVDGLFDVEDRGLHELKGASEPMRLFAVGREAEAGSRFTARLQQGLSAIVDRAAERALLADAWAEASGGNPRALLLDGEPGIGKSRLAHYGRELVSADGLCIELHGTPHHQATPLHSAKGALRTLWALDDLEDDAQGLATIASAVGRDPSLDPVVVSFLGDLVGVAAPAVYQSDMTPQRQRAMTLEAIVRLVLGEARLRPLLVLVEDLHWLDPTTRELLGMLLANRSNERLLVLITTRPGQPLDDLSGLEKVPLGPLSPEDAAQLAAVTLGVSGEDWTAAVVDQADGVPLFVEELARSVLESGLEHGSSIPDSLYSCLQARIDCLTPRAREVAQWAASYGRRFDPGVIMEVSGLRDEVIDNALDELRAAQLVVDQESKVQFRHVLIQEAAAGSLLRQESRSAHDAIANVLLNRGTEPPEVVAVHLRDAGRTDEAIDQFQQAGIAALGASAVLEALAHFDEALTLIATLPESRSRDEREAALQVLRAVPLTLTRGWASADVGVAYRRADALCDMIGETPQLFPTLVGLATFDIVRAAHEEAQRRTFRNRVIAVRSGNPELLLEAEHDCGTSAFYVGNMVEAVQHLDAAIELFDSSAHQHHVLLYGKNPGAVALLHAALSNWFLGHPDEVKGSKTTIGSASWHFPSALQEAVPSAKLCWISPADHELRIVLGYRSQTLCCRSVDGVLVPRAYGDDLEDGVIGLPVEKPEPLGSSICKVELDPGQARQVPADVARAERLPGHSTVGKIVEDPLSRVHRRRVDFF